MDSGHDLAEHGLDAERLLLAWDRRMELGRHNGRRKETRRMEKGRECGVRIIICRVDI